MIKTFLQSFSDIYTQGKTDIKPLGAKLGKLMEEVGELAECVNIHQGYITHKEMKEPLVGEVADVVQCALAILVDVHPEMSKKEVVEMFLEYLELKNDKWRRVQTGDAVRVAAKKQPSETPAEYVQPAGNIEKRVFQIVSEQLGMHIFHIALDSRLVYDLNADSLDLVELVMAIEDEFEFEVSDGDAETITTVGQIVSYVRMRLDSEGTK